MTIDIQTIFLAGLGLFCALLGWLGRELWGAVQLLRKDLSALEVRISREYVSYDRLADAMRPMLDGINEIKAALTHKQDKS